MELLESLHETCGYLSDDLKKCNEKIRKAGGELSAGEVEYLDKLTHAIKCVKTTVAMLEAQEGGDGYSQRYSYDEGSSYARGRMNAPRDSMGRYSRDGGMSRDYLDGGMSEIIEIARGKMVGLPPEEKRRRVQMITEELSK